MPTLSNIKHEQFAQCVAKGFSASAAYIAAGYSPSGAAASASRLLAKVNISTRIEELKVASAVSVGAAQIRDRSARLQVLQNDLNAMLSLMESRGAAHPGNPGAATGLMVKRYCGKTANRELWKFDSALVSQIAETLKQAAIEAGQWTEKRDLEAERQRVVLRENVERGKQRVAEYRRQEEANRAGANVLANTNHELFAQSIASGANGTDAYTTAYKCERTSKVSATACASRLLADGTVAARVENLTASITGSVGKVDIVSRSKRVQTLEDIFNRTCIIIQARAMEYSSDPSAATGLLAKSFGGKDDEEEIWTFDAPLMSQRIAIMKQVAIEEGQWRVKPEAAGTYSLDEIKARINKGRDRLAAEKQAALERGDPWPPLEPIGTTTAILSN